MGAGSDVVIREAREEDLDAVIGINMDPIIHAWPHCKPVERT